VKRIATHVAESSLAFSLQKHSPMLMAKLGTR
jgi:hypothetical protein